MYFLNDVANFSKPKTSKILRNSLIAGGLIASGIPQYAVQVASGSLMTKFPAADKKDLKDRAKKHGVKVKFPNDNRLRFLARNYGGINDNGAWAMPTKNTILLGKDGMRSKSVFYHELGHLKDKGFRYDTKIDPRSVRKTAEILRNETAANANAIKERGIAQVPHAGLNTINYGANAVGRHALGLAGLTVAGGAGLHYLRKVKKV